LNLKYFLNPGEFLPLDCRFSRKNSEFGLLFDAIIVTAAPDHVPEPLIQQLRPGGRLVIPVGPTDAVQFLQVLQKDATGQVDRTDVIPVRFVPFTRGD
jgi:protein-L-isoaspartate(D-aspartate) O-methyltransferase